jgi:DNA replication protein DnaC
MLCRPCDRSGRTSALTFFAIDDFALLEMDGAQAKLAFQVISERCDHLGTTPITANREPRTLDSVRASTR